jgi:circadian clock protein KaiC
MKKKTSELFPKVPTGISGLDEITGGGLPKGRPTLVCGSPGCGKTLFGIQFLINGIRQFNEPGVFISFEEPPKDLALNVKSLGVDLDKLVADKKLRIDHVIIERSEIEETGEYDLEALFIRINYAIDLIGAKRVVLDTIESLFGGLKNETVLRSELRRLFNWLKQKGVTVIITGERGDKTFTRQGMEEYVSDCVILLDFRVINQIATRRLRIVKYRGSTHGTNEYPFLIDENGISVLPVTSLGLKHKISNELISTGLEDLDNLFSTSGVFRGTSTLITGSAGTAKTTFSSYFALGSCLRREKTLFFSTEESPDQVIRNMRSLNINLKPYIQSGLLTIHSSRPSLYGLEMHLLLLHKLVEKIKPDTVIVDTISSFITIGSTGEVRDMLIRLIDMLKTNGINGWFTSLTHEDDREFGTTVNMVSSLADIWIRLTNDLGNLGHERLIRIIKSRGVGHSNEAHSFLMTNKGIKLIPRKQNGNENGSKLSLAKGPTKKVVKKK